MRSTGISTVYINLDGSSVDSPNFNQVLWDKAKTYENTCFNNIFISKITDVRQNGYITYMPNTYGVYNVKVIIVYDTIDISPGDIIHNAMVIMVHRVKDEGIQALCRIDENISSMCLIPEEGLVDIGMIIPIVASTVTYSQSSNRIGIKSSLMVPKYDTTPIPVYHIDIPDSSTIEKSEKLLELFKQYILTIKSKKRAVLFKTWMYPYKTKKTIISKKDKAKRTIYELFDGDEIQKMYVSMDDKYSVMDLEFKIVKANKLAVHISLDRFVEMVTESARLQWEDIRQLCETYEDDEVYEKHKPIWKYYDNSKKILKST